jgi:hypothetical protein
MTKNDEYNGALSQEVIEKKPGSRSRVAGARHSV